MLLQAQSNSFEMSNNYLNPLTPPSSNEDSTQYFVHHHHHSPRSTTSPDTNTNFIITAPVQIDPLMLPEKPYLKIIEQPVGKFRFRYKSEMTGTHGSLCGENSDRQRKQTAPTVELCNFDEPAILRCSIYQYNVTDDNKPHAHRLMRKEGKEEVDDPHDVEITPQQSMRYSFHNMGIIHTAKKNIVIELERKKMKLKREEIARLEGKFRDLTLKEMAEIKRLAEDESKSINLNVVCLRFDAFYKKNGILRPICPPVYSHGIKNLKSALTGELKIVRMDHCSSPAKGGREIFILVERVTKKNIKIKFFELDDEDNEIWQGYGKFTDLDVHHQYAIVFRTPAYRVLELTKPVTVFIQLVRPSDGATSEPKEFRYIPSCDSYKPGAKRSRSNYCNSGSGSNYDSSSCSLSLHSDELPVPVTNLFQTTTPSPPPSSIVTENETNMNIDYQITSAELQLAMTNINSDEFNQLFNEWGEEYLACNTLGNGIIQQQQQQQITQDLLNSTTSVAVDAATVFGKRTYEKQQRRPQQQQQRPILVMKNDVKRPPITFDEIKHAKDVVEDLRSLIKTKPSIERVIQMLKYYLNTPNKTNALHTTIKRNDTDNALFLLHLIYLWKQSDLLNIKNNDGETPLHIAIYCKNKSIIDGLIKNNADLSIGDQQLNTALHIAVEVDVSIDVLQTLLMADRVLEFINNENCDGNTPLNIAIENNNLRAVKMLLLRGADVNQTHKKSGYTPLRFAIEKQYLDIVKYILEFPGVIPLIEDFQGKSALYAAMKKENDELSTLIAEFMKTHDYSDMIKSEIEESMDDEEIEEKYSIKLEQVSTEDLRDMYSNITQFTTECLDEIAKILDQSGTWENLADLLDLGHLLRSGVYDSSESPTKVLLKFAIEKNGDTILQIRDFLENLDELQAVEIIDDMVKSQFI